MYSVVLITCGKEEEANKIARKLVEDKLAACVQIMPIKSIYTWKGKICEDAERLLFIKTKPEL